MLKSLWWDWISSSTLFNADPCIVLGRGVAGRLRCVFGVIKGSFGIKLEVTVSPALISLPVLKMHELHRIALWDLHISTLKRRKGGTNCSLWMNNAAKKRSFSSAQHRREQTFKKLPTLSCEYGPGNQSTQFPFCFSVIPNSLSRAPSDTHWSAEEVRRIKRCCKGAGAGTFEWNWTHTIFQRELCKAMNMSSNLLDKVRKQSLVGGAGLSFKCLIRDQYMLQVVHTTHWKPSCSDDSHWVEL